MKVEIGNYNFSVNFVESQNNCSFNKFREKYPDYDVVLGYCDKQYLEITIYTQCDKQVILKTIINTVTQAYLYAYGLSGIEKDNEFLSEFMSSYGKKILDTSYNIFAGYFVDEDINYEYSRLFAVEQYENGKKPKPIWED